MFALSDFGFKEDEYELVDIWTGENLAWIKDCKVTLSAHGSRAFYVKHKVG